MIVWLERSITEAHPPAAWTRAMGNEVKTLAAAAADGQPFETVGFWKLEDAPNEWFRALIAPPGDPSHEGRLARADLMQPPAAGVTVRWLELVGPDGTNVGTIASLLRSDGLHVFDPRSGHWTVGIAGSDEWFARLIRDHYPETVTEFRSHVLVVPTPVHFTWIGPPDPVAVPVLGQLGRRDIVGPERLALAAQAVNDPAIRIRFHCLATHAGHYAQALPQHTLITPVEDQLATQQQWQGLMLTRPPLDDLEICVDYIIRTSVAVGDGRSLVNAKNIWSMYCLWRYGGYHLDTGVVPLGAGTPVSFPRPTAFALADVSLEGSGGLRKATLTFGTYDRAQVDALVKDESSVFFERVMTDQRTAGTAVTLRGAQVDVWLIRSPQGDEQVRRALEYYIRAWFKINSMVNQLAALGKPAFRSAVLSAVLSGACPSGPDYADAWRQDVLVPHLIPANLGTVPSMGLQKVGFQSHV